MYKQKKDKEKEESKILYLRAESAEDICRLACKFYFHASPIKHSRPKQGLDLRPSG